MEVDLQMFITDAHCDTLRSIGVDHAAPESCAVTAQRLAQGGVGLQTFAMFAGGKGPAGTPYEDGLAMLGAIDKLGVPVYTGNFPETAPETPHGILSIEGGEMLKGDLKKLEQFDQAGRIRLIALTWNHENEIGFPAKAGPKGHLKPFGRALLQRMDQLGILADVSHLNEDGFWDIYDQMELPPVASHSNCRWLCPVPRNLRKEQVRAIIEKGGFIGINFYTYFLTRRGSSNLEDVFRHIDAICEMGGENVLGFGSDFDGIDSWPEGLANPADFPALLDVLRRHGYTESVIAKIAGENFWNLLKRAEKKRLG